MEKYTKLIQQGWKIASHFIMRLRQTPLLLAWLIVGPCIALWMDGFSGLIMGLINILLLGVYSVLIRWMTPVPPSKVIVKRPKMEIFLALVLFVFFIVIQLFDFEVWQFQPIYGWIRNFFSQMYTFTASIPALPEWALTDVYLAASSTVKKLIPTLIVFLLLGVDSQGMGLKNPHWKLSGVLVGVTALFGLFTGVLFSRPFYMTVILYVIGIFINAFPEEFFFRGFLFPRLEKMSANPLNALVLTSFLFNAMHLPIQMMNGTPFPQAFLHIFAIGYPSGLIWGYLYMRTRSILPGTIWHAANGNVGFLFMNF